MYLEVSGIKLSVTSFISGACFVCQAVLRMKFFNVFLFDFH